MRPVIKLILFCLALGLLLTTFFISSGCGGGSSQTTPPPSPPPPSPPPPDNPVPTISSLSATSAPAGWPGIPLLINGTGFVSGTTMQWNGSDRPSTHVSSSQLRTSASISDLAQPGSAQVTVVSPTPGGGTSAETTFTIEAIATGAVGVIERSSVSTDLKEADSGSFGASINADGRYVAFSSTANNLAGGNRGNVFLRDTCVGAPGVCTPSVSVISVSSQGQGGNGGSFESSISSTGRFVAFSSNATNLVSGDTNRFFDVFVRDTCIGTSGGCTPTTTRVSLDSAGNQILLESVLPSISGDGRFVAFATGMSGDYYTPGSFIINWRDTCTGAPAGCSPTTSRIDVGSGGVSGNGSSHFAIMSSSGRYVAFQSTATNLIITPPVPFLIFSVFLRDTCQAASGCTPSTTLISLDRSGNAIDAFLDAVSSDGRFVVFSTGEDNVVPDDTNGFSDVFVRDTCNGAPSGCVPGNTRVSLANDGSEGNGHSSNAAIGASARFIAFRSDATNLVNGDTNSNTDVFLRDTCIGATAGCTPSTIRLSVALDGTQSNKESFLQGITADGGYVVLFSEASTLSPSDTNSVADIFLARTNVP